MADKIEQLKTLMENHPNDPFIWFALAQEFEKAGEAKEALGWYEKLYRQRPDYVGTYYHWGKLLEKQNDAESAVNVYRTGIKTAAEQRDFHAKAELEAALEWLSNTED